MKIIKLYLQQQKKTEELSFRYADEDQRDGEREAADGEREEGSDHEYPLLHRFLYGREGGLAVPALHRGLHGEEADECVPVFRASV